MISKGPLPTKLEYETFTTVNRASAYNNIIHLAISNSQLSCLLSHQTGSKSPACLDNTTVGLKVPE